MKSRRGVGSVIDAIKKAAGAESAATETQKRDRRVHRVACVDALEPRQLLTSIVVNTPVDAIFPQDSGLTSLRSAIATADANGSPTTITFDPTVFATAQTIQMNGDLLDLNNSLEAITITGPAAGVTLNAGNLSGVFEIDSGTVNISNLTATDANTSAIVNSGILNLQNSTISNSGFGFLRDGGGLLNNSTATLTNDTISANSAFVGGGVDNNYGTITLIGDTFTGNVATSWPGVWGADGAAMDSRSNATLINDTFSANEADNGSILHTYGSLSMADCTVASNIDAVGINNGSGSSTAVVIENSIIANNATTGDASGNPFDSLGYNDIGNISGSSGWNALDLKGVNPNLAALANNGGPTQTMLPTVGSPVINAGFNAYIPAGVTTDQRGLPRVYNVEVDIGAVEVNPGTSTSTAVTTSNASVAFGKSVTLTATISSTLTGETGSVQFMDGNAALGSPVSVVNGSAAYTTSALAAGTHSITAIYSGDGNFLTSTSAALTQTVVPAPTLLGSPVINGTGYTPSGADAAMEGAQRSMVDSIVYTFSTSVTIGGNGFFIALTSAQNGVVPTLSWTAIAPATGGSSTQWAVTFSGAGTDSGSIANGQYSIIINPAAVVAASDGVTTLAAGRTDTFYRLYGDSNGDQVVNAGDNAKFKTSLSSYNPIFDYNGDGTINAGDNLQFKKSLLISYSGDGFAPTI
ncbi:MAG TPA: Ig-like domain repeat protein [Tepidisphaeraceae bacterium]|nr:Ig-like domain repeat protein [Tepidisphaeraceae bacterium]